MGGCYHNKGLAARWDYLSDGLSGNGWIVCRSCEVSLARLTVANGTVRGQGRFVEMFREQMAQSSGLVELAELEID